MIQLSNLKGLGLSFCTSLQSLPKLPLNMKFIGARCCTSLETLLIIPEDEFELELDLINCVKLIENQDYSEVLSGMLRRYIINYSLSLSHVIEVLSILIFMFQRHDKQEQHYGLVIPRSKIPKWLSHKNVGMSVNLQVPLDLLCNKFMGIVVSCFCTPPVSSI